MKLPNVFSLLTKVFLLIAFIVFSFFIIPTKALAQKSTPKPLYKCSTSDPDNEYHSLRPYPGSPCYTKASGAMLCGNNMNITDIIEEGPCNPFGSFPQTCSYNMRRSFTLKIDPSNADFPIAGQTELVPNSKNTDNQLDSAERVNEYISWYLNGVAQRAEESYVSDTAINDNGSADIQRVVDFSGPINRLLPLRIMQNKREEQVDEGSKKIEDQAKRHNQVVGCSLSILGYDLIPWPCYWVDTTGVLGWFKGLFEDALTSEYLLTNWKPSENKPPKSEDFTNFKDFYLAYREWRGDKCFPISILGKQIFSFCIPDISDPESKMRALLFPYIPLTGTEDRMGNLFLYKPSAVSTDGVEVIEPEFVDPRIDNQKDQSSVKTILYFPHTEEDAGLSSILQSTFKAKDLEQNSPGDIEPVTVNSGCVILQLRRNEGDSLQPESEYEETKIPVLGKYSYTAKFSCTFDGPNDICEKTVMFTSKVNTTTPFADQVWSNLVAGGSSVFRRIFPKVNTGSLGSLIDYPTVTTAQYSATGAQITPTTGELYLPHMGGVSEYFLKGIQTMLRPKGYGESIVFGDKISASSGDVNCNQSAPAIEVPGILNREQTFDLASRWGVGEGNKVMECYYDVVNRALAAGIHPGLALVIWLNESNASNYNVSEQDFGVNDSTILKNFNKQIERFLGIPKSSKYMDCANQSIWSSPMEGFLYMYKSGNCYKDGNEDGRIYYEMIRDEVWGMINYACPFPGYPTDNTCP